jgi:endonuclease/exonuclease/phosphatase family metal-dependent hydrolase
MTDRDVLLVREELATRSPLTHVFASNLPVLQIGGKVPTAVKRGYLSAVVESDLGALRIVDSHLEVGGPAAPIQELQADELVTALGSESPLLVLGDFNSAADNSSTASYGKLTAALSDAWTLSGTAETGHTCCSGLTDATFTADERIDLVLLRGLAVEAVAVTGIEARTATGRFAADHAGVVATVRSAE